MEITYMVIVAIVTYVLGAITKLKVDSIPNKYIPIQNVIIGLVSGLICYYTKVEPNLIQAIVLCFLSALGAGGTYDLINTKNKDS